MNLEGSIVFFGVKNLEETDSFYRDKLGLELYKDQGLCRIYRVPGGGMLGFCTHQDVISREKKPNHNFTDSRCRRLVQKA